MRIALVPDQDHIIIDTFEGEDVLILRIVHGRRDVAALSGRWRDVSR